MEWEEKGNFETISDLIMVCYSKHCYFILTSQKVQNCLNAFCQMSNTNCTVSHVLCRRREGDCSTPLPFPFFPNPTPFLPPSPHFCDAHFHVRSNSYLHDLHSTKLIASDLVTTTAPAGACSLLGIYGYVLNTKSLFQRKPRLNKSMALTPTNKPK